MIYSAPEGWVFPRHNRHLPRGTSSVWHYDDHIELGYSLARRRAGEAAEGLPNNARVIHFDNQGAPVCYTIYVFRFFIPIRPTLFLMDGTPIGSSFEDGKLVKHIDASDKQIGVTEERMSQRGDPANFTGLVHVGDDLSLGHFHAGYFFKMKRLSRPIAT